MVKKELFSLEVAISLIKMGKKKKWLHEKIGMGHASFYTKMKYNGFTDEEQAKIKKLLK